MLYLPASAFILYSKCVLVWCHERILGGLEETCREALQTSNTANASHLHKRCYFIDIMYIVSALRSGHTWSDVSPCEPESAPPCTAQPCVDLLISGRSQCATSAMPSLKSDISSARWCLPLHWTLPFLSMPKLPPVCHLFPLSVGLFQMPSSLPSFFKLLRPAGDNTW